MAKQAGEKKKGSGGSFLSSCCFYTVLLVALSPALFLFSLYLGDNVGFAQGLTPVSHLGKPYGFTFDRIPDLTGKVAVVTGANVGLGYGTALHLARNGATTVLACRSLKKCDAAAAAIKTNSSKAKVETIELDLSSMKSVRAFAKKFNAEHDRLDTLVLNAGVMMCPFTLSPDGIEMQFATNHVGHFLLTSLLEDKLVAAAPSTIVPVSSNAHHMGYPDGVRTTLKAINDEATYDRAAAYGQSKLANVLFSNELSRRLKEKKVYVNSLHPGWVKTELDRHVSEALVNYLGASVGTPVANQLDALIRSFTWDPETASLTQLYAAVAPEITREGITGKFYHPIARVAETHPLAQDEAAAKALWKFTEDLIASKSG